MTCRTFCLLRTDPISVWAGGLRLDGIATDPTGTIGDVTADQAIQPHDCPPHEFVQLSYVGDQPETTWHNCLYLEWFSHRKGRVPGSRHEKAGRKDRQADGPTGMMR